MPRRRLRLRAGEDPCLRQDGGGERGQGAARGREGRRALRGAGISVSLVKPGDFSTKLNPLPGAKKDLTPVVEAVRDAITSPSPLARYHVGSVAVKLKGGMSMGISVCIHRSRTARLAGRTGAGGFAGGRVRFMDCQPFVEFWQLAILPT